MFSIEVLEKFANDDGDVMSGMLDRGVAEMS